MVRCLCTVVCRRSGFTSRKAAITAEIRLSDLAKVEGGVVNLNTLKAADIIGMPIEFAKVILAGEVTTPVTVRGLRVLLKALVLLSKLLAVKSRSVAEWLNNRD